MPMGFFVKFGAFQVTLILLVGKQGNIQSFVKSVSYGYVKLGRNSKEVASE